MKGLIIFSDGMEDSEALSTVALLRRAGISIDSVTSNSNLLVKTGYDQRVIADNLIENIDIKDYQFLVIPGGGYVDKIIDKDIEIKQLITLFNDANKPLAAICAAPRFLGRLGLLDGVDYTAFPGSEEDAPKGRYQANKKALTSGNIITGRSAGAVVEFVYEIVCKIKGEKAAKSLLKNIIY